MMSTDGFLEGCRQSMQDRYCFHWQTRTVKGKAKVGPHVRGVGLLQTRVS